MTRVEITYNPYTTSSRIVIGTRPISQHDELAKYLREPLHLWCHELFEILSRELNDEYEMVFVSEPTECEIMSVLAEQDRDCVSFTARSCPVNLPVTERVNRLMSTAGGEESFQINLAVPEGKQALLSCIRQRCSPSGDERMTADCPYRNSRLSLVFGGAMGNFSSMQTLNVFVSDSLDDKNSIPNSFWGTVVLFILLSADGKLGFTDKRGDLYQYNESTETVYDCLLRFLEYRCVVPRFKQLITGWRENTRSAGDFPEMQVLDSIEPVVRVSCPETVETGCAVPVNITVFPQGWAVPELIYKCVFDNIVECRDGMIYGISAGHTDIEVYIKGSVDINTRLSITAVQRNRITSITPELAMFSMPIDGVTDLSYTYLPENADNVGMVRMSSSNSKVIRVDNNRDLCAVGLGECVITLEAEGVKSETTATVLEVVRQIKLSTSKIKTFISQRAALTYEVSPKGRLFRGDIKVYVLDESIAAYNDGQVLPKVPGTTFIVFENERTGVKAQCEVTVESSLGIKRDTGMGYAAAAVILTALSFMTGGIFRLILAGLGAVLAFYKMTKYQSATVLMLLTIVCAGLSGVVFFVGSLGDLWSRIFG